MDRPNTKEYQPRTKEGSINKEIILKELRKGKLSFGEIIEDTGLPRGTVGRHLKKMLRNDEIFIVWDKKTEKKVYTANRKFIINKLLIPELMMYAGADLLGQIFYGLTQGENQLKLVSGFQPGKDEKGGRPLYSTYNLDIIFKTLVEDKYFIKGEDKKITPQEILDEMRSNPELMEYVRSITSKEDENYSYLIFEYK